MNYTNKLVYLAKRANVLKCLDNLEMRGFSEAKKIRKLITSEITEDSAMTSADWGRLGLVFGVLWAKLDIVINALNSGNKDRQEIARKLSDMSNAAVKYFGRS